MAENSSIEKYQGGEHYIAPVNGGGAATEIAPDPTESSAIELASAVPVAPAIRSEQSEQPVLANTETTTIATTAEQPTTAQPVPEQPALPGRSTERERQRALPERSTAEIAERGPQNAAEAIQLVQKLTGKELRDRHIVERHGKGIIGKWKALLSGEYAFTLDDKGETQANVWGKIATVGARAVSSVFNRRVAGATATAVAMAGLTGGVGIGTLGTAIGSSVGRMLGEVRNLDTDFQAIKQERAAQGEYLKERQTLTRLLEREDDPGRKGIILKALADQYREEGVTPALEALRSTKDQLTEQQEMSAASKGRYQKFGELVGLAGGVGYEFLSGNFMNLKTNFKDVLNWHGVIFSGDTVSYVLNAGDAVGAPGHLATAASQGMTGLAHSISWGQGLGASVRIGLTALAEHGALPWLGAQLADRFGRGRSEPIARATEPAPTQPLAPTTPRPPRAEQPAPPATTTTEVPSTPPRPGDDGDEPITPSQPALPGRERSQTALGNGAREGQPALPSTTERSDVLATRERPTTQAEWLQYAMRRGNAELPTPAGEQRYVEVTHANGEKRFGTEPVKILEANWDSGKITLHVSGYEEPITMHGVDFFRRYGLPKMSEPVTSEQPAPAPGEPSAAEPPKTPEQPVGPMTKERALALFGMTVDQTNDRLALARRFRELVSTIDRTVTSDPATFTPEERARQDAADAQFKDVKAAYELLTREAATAAQPSQTEHGADDSGGFAKAA